MTMINNYIAQLQRVNECPEPKVIPNNPKKIILIYPDGDIQNETCDIYTNSDITHSTNTLLNIIVIWKNTLANLDANYCNYKLEISDSDQQQIDQIIYKENLYFINSTRGKKNDDSVNQLIIQTYPSESANLKQVKKIEDVTLQYFLPKHNISGMRYSENDVVHWLISLQTATIAKGNYNTYKGTDCIGCKAIPTELKSVTKIGTKVNLCTDCCKLFEKYISVKNPSHRSTQINGYSHENSSLTVTGSYDYPETRSIPQPSPQKKRKLQNKRLPNPPAQDNFIDLDSVGRNPSSTASITQNSSTNFGSNSYMYDPSSPFSDPGDFLNPSDNQTVIQEFLRESTLSGLTNSSKRKSNNF